MRRTNWKNIEKQTTDLKRKIKHVQNASDYLAERPEEGYFIDNISKKKVKISECKESTLRRYLTSLDKYYYLVSSIGDKNFILEKKIEIENELEKRAQNE